MILKWIQKKTTESFEMYILYVSTWGLSWQKLSKAINKIISFEEEQSR